jgi:hypothetical protein
MINEYEKMGSLKEEERDAKKWFEHLYNFNT